MDEFQTPVGGGEDFFAGAFPVCVSALVAFPSRVDARRQHSEWGRGSRVGSMVFPPRARLAFLPRASDAPTFRVSCALAIPNPPLRVVLARVQPPSPRDLEKARLPLTSRPLPSLLPLPAAEGAPPPPEMMGDIAGVAPPVPPADDMAGMSLGDASSAGGSSSQLNQMHASQSGDPLAPLGGETAPIQDMGATDMGAMPPVQDMGAMPPVQDMGAMPPVQDMGAMDMGSMAPPVQDPVPVGDFAEAPPPPPQEMGDFSDPVVDTGANGSAHDNMTNGNAAAPTMAIDEPSTMASEAMAKWHAEQESALAEKRAAEEREIKQIREEAAAERELMYSQHEKQLQAAYKANRERQVVMEQQHGEGWEAVLGLISDSNLVKDSTTDLSRFKQILTRLKHQKPLSAPM